MVGEILLGGGGEKDFDLCVNVNLQGSINACAAYLHLTISCQVDCSNIFLGSGSCSGY